MTDIAWKRVPDRNAFAMARILGPGSAMVEDAWYEATYAGYFVTVEPRPMHCDRGHWVAKASVVGPGPEIGFPDGSEGWPRYFMSRERALAECEDWLKWRAQKDRGEEGRYR